GGFSYGDYLRCGAIAARAPVMDAVRAHAARGGLVLGVCNGFQILCESGLLPGVLMRNQQLRFICRDVYLRVERSDTPFTRGYNAGQVIRVPVAHGEGNYTADAETLKQIEAEGRVLFRYTDPRGEIDLDWNHNGAANAIGGVLAVVFKMESHNHPSYIEPYQGAATGVGGILRDVFTMGARPIACLNALSFGDPAHPKTRHLVSGVVAGIGGYGNSFGVPTVGGQVRFHTRYDGNNLVNAMAVGLAETDKIFYAAASGVNMPIV